MNDIENFFNTSEIYDFKKRLDEDPNFLETIKNNKSLMVNNSMIEGFKFKLIILLEKDINPFDFYLTQRTFDIKDCLDFVIIYYSEKGNLKPLCEIVNNLKGSNDLSFWGVLQNLKYIIMRHGGDYKLNEFINCCKTVFENSKKKYKFNGMNRFL